MVPRFTLIFTVLRAPAQQVHQLPVLIVQILEPRWVPKVILIGVLRE